jgi:glutamate/tyrosine decarboxylase-like PLP-dependent enzyme
MPRPDERERVLSAASELASAYLDALPARRVGPLVGADAISSALGRELPAEGVDAERVIRDLAAAVDPGLMASAGPRFFGLVVGGALPASVGADWLTAAWDQNAVLHVASPAAAAAEQVAGEWLLDLLDLPADAGFGLTGGAGLANTVALAAARHAVLERAGWDVEAHGLFGAPEIRVLIGEEAHATLETALQYLGLGRERVVRVAADGQGRMIAEALADHLAADEGPTIVCSQAGNVNTGASDPLDAIADLLASHQNAWQHVDGAFGLWANVSPLYRKHVRGVERADSWATDAHKWLNVGYDCGFVATAHPDAQRAAMSMQGAYLAQDATRRDNSQWLLDSSRRARGFPVYAVLRSLGRDGVRDLVERCCAHAERIAARLREAPGVTVLNEVVLNQVLVRFTPAPPAGADADAHTQAVIRGVQDEGVAWLGGTTWHGMAAMRISVSNWSTTEADADATVDSILRAHGRA